MRSALTIFALASGLLAIVACADDPTEAQAVPAPANEEVFTNDPLVGQAAPGVFDNGTPAAQSEDGEPGQPIEFRVNFSPEQPVFGGRFTLKVEVTEISGNPRSDVSVKLDRRSNGVLEKVSDGMSDKNGQWEYDLFAHHDRSENTLEVTVGERTREYVVAARPLSSLKVRTVRRQGEQVGIDGPLSVQAGSDLHLEAIGTNEFGQEVQVSPLWSLSPEIGVLTSSETDEPGRTFTARSAGTGTVRAQVGDHDGEIELTVESGSPKRLEVRSAAVQPAGGSATVRVTSGQTVDLSVVVLDAGGNEVNYSEKTVEWSLTPPDLGDLVELEQGIQLEARSAGSGKVTARLGELNGESPVEVTAGPWVLADVKPDNPEAVKSGTTKEFHVVGWDAAGNETSECSPSVQPKWSLSDKIGSFDEKGRFLAERAGRARLVVNCDGVAASTVIEVDPGSLASITVYPLRHEMKSGTTTAFRAVGRDAEGNEVAIEPDWRVSSLELGQIDRRGGELTAERAGDGHVIASSGGVSGTAKLTVMRGALTSLDVDPDTPTVTAGSSLQFIVTAEDRAGNRVTVEPDWNLSAVDETCNDPDGDGENEEVTGSSGTGCISPDGAFVGKTAGEVTLVATSENLSVDAKITVTHGDLVSLLVRPVPSEEIPAGSHYEFEAVGVDANGNEWRIDNAVWGVSGGVGTIATGGRFTGIKRGEGSVAATVDGLSAVRNVEVVPGSLDTITITGPDRELQVGEAVQLSLQGTDAHGNDVGLTEPAWKVEDDGIGEVDDQAQFVAKAPGTSTITAELGSVVSDPVQVKILSKPLVDLRIVGVPSSPVPAGDPIRLSAEGTREKEANGEESWARVTDVSWFTKFTDVDSTGPDDFIPTFIAAEGFTPTRAGRLSIRVARGSLIAETEVEIVPGKVASIVVEPPRVTIVNGTNQPFTATAYDAYGNKKNDLTPDWSVTSGIGSVDTNGSFSATQAGTGVVSATFEKKAGTADVTIQ